MYQTLMKNESRLQSRALLTILAIAAAVVAGAIALILFKIPVLSPLAMMLGAVAVIALAAGIPAYLLVRYYQSMYGREGYLTHVVPAKASTLYGAKYTWAYLVTLLGLVAAVALGIVLMLAIAVANGASVSTWWSTVMGFFGSLSGLQTTLLIVAVIVGLAIYVAQFAWVVTFGMEDRFRKLGIGGPVLVWFLNYLVMQLALLAAIMLIPLGVTPEGHLTTVNFATELLRTAPGQSDIAAIPLGFVPVLLLSLPIYIGWTIHSIKKHTSLR